MVELTIWENKITSIRNISGKYRQQYYGNQMTDSRPHYWNLIGIFLSWSSVNIMTEMSNSYKECNVVQYFKNFTLKYSLFFFRSDATGVFSSFI